MDGWVDWIPICVVLVVVVLVGLGIWMTELELRRHKRWGQNGDKR